MSTNLQRRRKRNLGTWVRGGGISNLVFLLPMLVIFGVFSWGPIVQAGIMSFQIRFDIRITLPESLVRFLGTGAPARLVYGQYLARASEANVSLQ